MTMENVIVQFEKYLSEKGITEDKAIVKAAYVVLHDKPAKAGGVEWWVSEFKDTKTFVEQFVETADSLSVADKWATDYENGVAPKTVEEISALFVEYLAANEIADPAKIVEAAYQVLHDKPAKAGGVEWWVSEFKDTKTFVEQFVETANSLSVASKWADKWADEFESGEGEPGEPSSLTEALTELQDSEKAVDDFLKNWGAAQEPVVTNPIDTQVHGAVEFAEAAVDTAAGEIASLTSATLTDYNVVDTPAANQDQLEDARLALLNVEVAALVATAEALVNTTAKALNDLPKAGLKAAVDSYILAADNAVKADAAVTTGGALFDNAATAVAVFNAATGVSVAAPTAYGAVIDLLGDSSFTYDVATKAWTVPAALQSSPYLADLQSSVVALNAGFQAKDNADALVDLRLESIVAIDSTQVDDATTPTALALQADAYADAVAALAELNAAVAELAEAVSAVDAARADSAALAALEKTVADQEKALVDAGYSVEAIVDNSIVAGSAADDIFVLSTMEAGDDAQINDFGTLGDDKLFIGNEFTLNSGALTDGDNSVKEVFFIQNGVNTDVIFESVDFGSNAATPEVFTITLTGVTAADLSLSDDGYISIA